MRSAVRAAVLGVTILIAGCGTPPAEPCGLPAPKPPLTGARQVSDPREIRAVFAAARGRVMFHGEPYLLNEPLKPSTQPLPFSGAQFQTLTENLRKSPMPHKLHGDQSICFWTLPATTPGGDARSVTVRWEALGGRGGKALVSTLGDVPERERVFGRSDGAEAVAFGQSGEIVGEASDSWWCQIWRDGDRWAVVSRPPVAALSRHDLPKGVGTIETYRVSDSRDEDGIWRLIPD